jgi:hypothetical protein
LEPASLLISSSTCSDFSFRMTYENKLGIAHFSFDTGGSSEKLTQIVTFYFFEIVIEKGHGGLSQN